MSEKYGFRPEQQNDGKNVNEEDFPTRRGVLGALGGVALAYGAKKFFDNGPVEGSNENNHKTESGQKLAPKKPEKAVPNEEKPIKPPKSIETNLKKETKVTGRIFDDIDAGWDMLTTKKAGFWFNRREVPNKERSKKGKRKAKTKIVKDLDYNVLLAVKNLAKPNSDIEIISVDSKGGSQNTGFRVAQGDKKGVGTSYEVETPADYAVLAIKRVIPLDSKHQEVIYTPYTEALDTPLVRKKGFDYLLSQIEEGSKALDSRGINSRAFSGRKISEVIPKRVSLILSIIEHVDPFMFERASAKLISERGMSQEKADTEAVKSVVNQTLVTVGANREMSYAYAKSSAGARGLFQFIPSTYKEVRKQYKKADLEKDFVKGMDDHKNAAMASLLLFDADLAYLDKDSRDKIIKDPKKLGMYLSSSYNGGAPRTAKMIRENPNNWQQKVLPETQTYIRKFLAVYHLLENN
jgi:hypothetical protein